MKRPGFTYANVMSTIALFIALGGTSYAVARNSIGTAQLKKNAVTSGKVRNHSLTATDLASSVLSSGRRGPRGAAGPAGATRPRGPADGVVGTGTDTKAGSASANGHNHGAGASGPPAGR